MRPLHSYLTKLGLALVLFAAVAALPGRAAAQELEPPRQRQGYWVQFGLNAMMAETWEKSGHLGPWLGDTLSVRMGQLLTRRFGLGLSFELGGGNGKGWGYKQIFAYYGLGLEAQWNPWRNLGVHGGIGLAVVEMKATEGPDQSLRGNLGTGYSLAVSYDWFPLKKKLTGGFSLTPTVIMRYIPGNTVDTLMGLIGVQIGFWSGMPRNQLELDETEAYKN